MVGDVKAKVVRSDGQEMTFGNDDWRIPNDGLENWANLPYNVSSVEIPSYDGALVTSKRVSSTDRTITAICTSKDPEAQRARVIAFFNPEYTYEIHMTYMGRTRWCQGELTGCKVSEYNIHRPPSVTFTILCPNPFLLSEGDFGKDIAAIVGNFGFPFMSFLPVSKGSVPGTNVGFIASHHMFSRQVDISNDGDVPSGMRVIIRAKGEVVNPLVRIGDGYVRMLITMHEGDVVTLDASSRPPLVTYNGANAMHKVDRKSSILNMMIAVGNTTIEYDADDGEQSMSVSVFFNKQYLGV